jgi:phosphoribosylamine-glycine ligase
MSADELAKVMWRDGVFQGAVVKCNGLQDGKGVWVCSTVEETLAAIDEAFAREHERADRYREHGWDGPPAMILIEERLGVGRREARLRSDH